MLPPHYYACPHSTCLFIYVIVIPTFLSMFFRQSEQVHIDCFVSGSLCMKIAENIRSIVDCIDGTIGLLLRIEFSAFFRKSEIDGFYGRENL